MDLDNYDVAPELLELIPEDDARRLQVVPVARIGNVLTVAVADPWNVLVLDDLRLRTGCEVLPVVAADTAIRRALDRLYAEPVSELMEMAGDFDAALERTAIGEERPAVVKLADLIIVEALKARASEIHIDPAAGGTFVKLLVDGVLQEKLRVPAGLSDQLANRFKIMGGVPQLASGVPQQCSIPLGQIAEGLSGEYLHVSTFPTDLGQRAVMRFSRERDPTAGAGARRFRYDVFISAKSEDYGHANTVYEHLTSRGIEAFFSERSLPDLGRGDFGSAIDDAIDGSRDMVVVVSRAEYVRAGWVHDEWRMHVNNLRSGRNPGGGIYTVAAGGLQSDDLPASLRSREVIPFGPEGLEKLVRFLQSRRGTPSGNGSADGRAGGESNRRADG